MFAHICNRRISFFFSSWPTNSVPSIWSQKLLSTLTAKFKNVYHYKSTVYSPDLLVLWLSRSVAPCIWCLRLRWDVILTFLTGSVSTARGLNSEIRQKTSHKIIRAYIALAFWIPTFGACLWFRKNGDKSCSLSTKFLRILLSCYLDSWGDKGNKSQDVYCCFRDNISSVCQFEYKTEDVFVVLSRKLHHDALLVVESLRGGRCLVYSAGEVSRSSPPQHCSQRTAFHREEARKTWTHQCRYTTQCIMLD